MTKKASTAAVLLGSFEALKKLQAEADDKFEKGFAQGVEQGKAEQTAADEATLQEVLDGSY